MTKRHSERYATFARTCYECVFRNLQYKGMKMEEWKECKLGDLVTVKGGKRLPKGINLISTKNSHPYIRIRDLGKSKYLQLNSDYEYVDDETQKSISRYITNKGDVLISIVGTIGLIGIVGESLDNANLTENCVKLIDLKNIDSNYLYYFLSSEIGQNEIKKGTVGAVQPKLPIKNIQDIDIPIPPLPTQQKIAAILSSLDDKIELNNKINTNLEQQAQALFKNWFVDFEPFGGKMPEGWKVGKLSELITVKYGKDHKKIDDGNIPVYGSGGIMRYVEKSLYDKESVLIPRKGSLNNVFYINEPFWSVDTMFYTEMKKENIAKFVYFFVKGKDLNAMNAGSAVPSMTTEILNALEVIIPSDEYLVKFETIVSPMFKQIKQCIMENKNLSIIRDTLLPKLMNGEIDI